MDNCLLLDFDGVIVNNNTINKNVSKRASLFLSDNTNLKPKKAIKINQKYYRKFGHTLYLTNHINDKRKDKHEKLTITDFNDYIYTDDFIQHKCLNNLNSNDINLYTEWAMLINRTKYDSIFDDVIIFSNAPTIWIEQSIKKLHDMSSIKFNVDDIISVPEKFNEKLKPDIEPYNLFTESYVYDNAYVYIDDNETNLQYTKWINCLFDPMKKRTTNLKNDNENYISILSSPSDLYSILK